MIWLILVTLLVGIGRFLIPGHHVSLAGTYEALAHIWIGVLATIAIMKLERDWRILCWGMLAVITILEGFMFVHQGWAN